MVGGSPVKTHEECTNLICAVCTNLHGSKAQRTISSGQALMVKKHVFPSYIKGNLSLPQGICNTCRIQLIKLEQKTENVSLLLPEDYICEIPIQTRSKSSTVCSCRWCALARMNGVQFRKWKNSLKKTDKLKVAFICPDCGRGVASGTAQHTCSATDQERVQGLLQTLPEAVKAKLTVALVKEQQEQHLAPSCSQGWQTGPADSGKVASQPRNASHRAQGDDGNREQGPFDRSTEGECGC